MKRISIYRKLMVVAGCVALVCSANVGVSFAAQDSLDVSVDAKATVVTPIAFTSKKELNFGSFFAGAGTETKVTIAAADGTRTKDTGTAVEFGSLAGNQAGEVIFTGDASQNYLAVVDPNVSLTHTDTKTTMAATLIGTGLTGTGGGTVKVGGDLTVASAQKPGVYSGTFHVIISYN